MNNKKIFKYLLAIIPIIWILSLVDMRQFFVVFRKTSWWTLPLILTSNLLAFIIQGTRWWMLIRAFIPDLKWSKAVSFHFIGVFYSIILPSSAAQDFVRTVLISKDESYSVTWAATWLCRLFGIISIFTISVYGFLQFDKIRTTEYVPQIILSIFLLALLLLILSFSKKITRPIRLCIAPIIPKNILSIIFSIRDGIYLFRDRKKILAEVFIVTLLMHTMLFFTTAYVILGITGEWYLKEVFAFAPIIEFMCMMIPITPNGMGIRDMLSKQMFAFLGFSDEELGVYVVIIMLTIVFRLIGGIPLLFSLKSKKKIA